MNGKNLWHRTLKFILAAGLTLSLIFGLLPWLTGSVTVLHRMSMSLEENGIDPSRYYYTDVEQVIESEQYLRTVLDNE
ncbi:MAG: hypothetical protein V1793_20245 [Pseudomonadota bacterium]